MSMGSNIVEAFFNSGGGCLHHVQELQLCYVL